MDIVENPDKTLTVTLGAVEQSTWDALKLARGLKFLTDWFDGKFSQLTQRAQQIAEEDILGKFRNAAPADKTRVRDILEGRA